MGEPIVIFGGTFDPVHHGHLIVARAAAEARGLPRVTLMPAATPPHKPPAGASGEDRLEMLRLAVEGESSLTVSDMELRRPGPSYTIDTLEQLRCERPDADLHLLVGTDMLEDLPAWHRARDVVATAKLLVAARRPWQQRLEDVLGKLRGHFDEPTVERLRESVVETPRVEVSSTDVRQRVRQGLSIRYLVPEPVREYVQSRGLYRGR
jgi:nicotinate-nucleotide adenylyltransferase